MQSYSANMQSHEWSDVRYALALARAGTLSGAANALRVSDTTVARRIAALERALGVVLFTRNASGRSQPTEAAAAILRQAEMAALAHDQIGAIAGQQGAHLAGTVRLSAVPILINRVIVPRLPQFWATHPDVQVELVPEARNLDLTQREADLAIRFARPVAGGLRIKTQKLGVVAFDVFAPVGGPDDLPWITYDDAHESLPQARWLQKQVGRVSRLKVSDAETALEAAANGLGRTLLPVIAAETAPRLRCVAVAGGRPVARDVWLLSHAAPPEKSAVSAFKSWLIDLDWSDSGTSKMA